IYTGSTYTVELFANVPASDLTTTGTASITVNTSNATPSTSNAVTVSIVNPPAPTLTSISPSGGPINTSSAETLTGTGFTTNTTVFVNGQTIPSTFVSSTQITANFPAYVLATPGNDKVTVTTPAPGGGTSAAQVYTTFISIPNNDMVYNSADGLLYASVPASTAGAIGNCVVAIDPYTGVITRQIQVGTNPNRLALSTDGTQLFVGVDGAGAVAQINLAQGKIVNQFSLGGGPGVYNAPYTAAYLAAVPGLPNSVVVATTGEYSNGSGVTIFDSGVARTGNSVNVSEGPLSFGPSASTLYIASSNVDALTVGSIGITSSTQLAPTPNYFSYPSNLQYDHGALYFSTGQVLNASTGALNGTFYSTGTTQAYGPIVSDSTLGKAFVAASSQTNLYNSNAIYVFDETSFTLLGTIPVNDLGSPGYSTSFRAIVRWGQNGIALAAIPSVFTSNNQIYIFQSPLVKDVSSTPADLSISLTAPATAATGTAISYAAKVTNAGPNAAVGATLSASLDPSLIVNSVTASQGSCTTATTFVCDIAGLGSGASVTVTVNATPTSSGTLSATASVSSSSYDPKLSNNQATASTTVTGSSYGAVPSISSISPNLVQAGSAAVTLTVTGTGFNANSTVNLGGAALATTYVSSTQLTAAVTATAIANYGWAPVTVSNPTPGGGVSSVVPLTIYDLVNVTPNSILFDPYSQSLYATIPSDATGITGNTVAAINPFTGAVGTPVVVGSQPTAMAESGDGNDLYISLSGSQTLAQYDPIRQKLLQTITFSGQPTSANASVATALAVMPGIDTTLAVDFSGVDGIMDVNGTTGTFRPDVANASFPTFGDATHLYTYDNYSTGAEFYRYSVNASGLTLIDGTTLDGMGGFSGGFQTSGGFIYGFAGGIINPVTTPPSQVQTLPLIDFYNSGSIGEGVAVDADPSLQKDFIMQENNAGTSAYGLVRYDLNSYLPEAVLDMPASASSVESTWTMQRFGQDGLALLSYNTVYTTPPAIQLLLIRGPFIAPQELTTNTAASLTSSSAASITHGAGNTVLTLTGSNFLPGIAVTWNGSYRTTTIVDSSHVMISIPASDLSAAGSISIVATNPGAPASNTLHITIN
ncbi:MAG: IPT/TIG domain-containing protein, partial [Acidobacteriaceae bacterium]